MFLLMPCLLSAQGISNLWMLGYNGGQTSNFGGTNVNFFNGYPDTSHVNRTMSFLDCNANISDENGNLLFYTNGIFIANANNDTMMNGENLNPSVYTSQNLNSGLRVRQGNLILPFPGDSTKYYLFHETLYYISSISDYRPLEIYYSIIDMSLDGGLGAVVQKNVVLLSDTLTIGGITSCKHANGRDWWIVFHKSTGKTYYKYLLNPSGLVGPYQQDIGYDFPINDFIWQSCFSPDGKKFSSVMALDTIDIINFDRCTGLFSQPTSICIRDSSVARGVAFSPNSEYLYVSSTKYFYQFNVYSASIDSSRIILGVYDGFADLISLFRTSFYLAQLANDGKIYINSGNGTRWLHVINNPNNPGLSCNFVQHGFLLPTFNAFTIPNFPNYFLGAEGGTVCDSLITNVTEDYSNYETNIYPNPVYNCLHVSDMKENDVNVNVFSITGSKLSLQNTSNSKKHIQLDTSTLSPGVYIVEVINSNSRMVRRFIKH